MHPKVQKLFAVLFQKTAFAHCLNIPKSSGQDHAHGYQFQFVGCPLRIPEIQPLLNLKDPNSSIEQIAAKVISRRHAVLSRDA
jgi:hypothetical protein